MADDADAETANSSTADKLPEEKRHILIQFQEIVAIDGEEESLRILERHNWNLEVAVQSTFNENEGLPPVYNNDEPVISESTESSQDENISSPRPATPKPIHRNFAHGQSAVDVFRRNSWMELFGHVAFLPLTVAHVGYSFCYHCISELILFLIRIVHPNFRRAKTQPIEDILKFKKEYEESYGVHHPTFYLGSYSQVLDDAKKELKFLLVYLHGKDHQSTADFCHTVLSNPGFTEYINGNMLFWGCDVNTNEGYKVSRAMRETMYPFLAIVCLRDNRMTVVWRIEGAMEVDQLISICAQVIDENEASLVAARSERNERSINQELRDDQDSAYIQSLIRDQEKEKERQMKLEAKRKEEELRIKQENEKRQKKEDLATRRDICRSKINQLIEPSANEEGTIKIRIKLPNGRQLQRFFLKSNQLQILYDFVLSFDDAPSEFILNTNFPRESYPLNNNHDKCLDELGIHGPTAFFVQSLLDDSSDEDN